MKVKRKRTGKGMENVSLAEIYHEVRQMRKELNEIKNAFIPSEPVSRQEAAELDEIFEDMRKGHKTPLRQALKK